MLSFPKAAHLEMYRRLALLRERSSYVKPLEYGHARGSILGSSNFVRYWEQRRDEYGPPDFED